MLPLLRKLIVVSACCMLGIALPATSGAGAATTTLAANSATVTKIKLNGQFAELFLVDPATNTMGGLAASKDQIANTSGLDFSYAYPDPANPDEFTLIEAAGEIPNSAFTITSTTAHLAVTVTNSTSYIVVRCLVNQVTQSIHCALDPTPISFNLTWVKNGLGSASEKMKGVEITGPVTRKFEGSFTRKTANVNGTWDTRSAANFPGYLEDTQGTDMTREITVQMNP